MLTVLVTGANRGIGLEVCRQLASQGLHVLLTGRNSSTVAEAARALASSGLGVHGQVLDVASEASVAACAARLEQRGEHVDVLINNAGVYPRGDLLSVSSEVLTEAMAINCFGAMSTSRVWMPGMIRRGYGRIVSVTSGYGSFSEGLEGRPPTPSRRPRSTP